MNVRTLIERLSTLDPELPVIIPRWSLELSEVESADLDTVALTGDGPQLAYPQESGAVRVVRLTGGEDD